MVEPGNNLVSIQKQCELLGISRSSYYYQPATESDLNLAIMRAMDEQYTLTPFYGVLRMLAHVRQLGYEVNEKRIRRLLRLMGLYAIYPKKDTSKAGPGHKVYPYLLRGVEVVRVNQVWSTDITYIRMERGFMYLVAVIDWFSRRVLSWRLSNTMDVAFCVEALHEALDVGTPEIFNTDQGSQFTSNEFTGCLLDNKILVSMDGRGRCLDNVFVERLWRTVKQEYVYLHEIRDGKELWQGLDSYFKFYNNKRLHQSLDYKTPSQVYWS
jgi:putative transposase